MHFTRTVCLSLVLLLVGGGAIYGPAFIPQAGATMRTTQFRAAATSTTQPLTGTSPSAATPTAQPVTATLTITPTSTNRGGLVAVSGTGFAASETVTLTISGTPGVAATAKADAKGLLPTTGISIPYSLKPGVYTVVATGATSKRTASSMVTVKDLTPSISLSPTSVSPGDTVTATGQGFGRQEQVTLALNGAALSTIPAVITTTNSAFSASFKVPSSLLRGANTVSAIGNQSRVSAVATLTGNLPVASTFYFVGGMNTASAHSFVHLLNTNGQPAQARLTFFFDSGATDTKLVDVAPTDQKVVAVSELEHTMGVFGLMLTADRQISAQLTIKRDGKDNDTLLGNTGLDTRWYLAEGYTGLTFHESVAILNPDFNAPAHVLLHLLPFSGRPGLDVPVTVPVHSTYVANINKLMPGQSLSIEASADRPVVVERTLTFSNDGFGMTTRSGSNRPATSWIFAEGTTVNRFQTFLTILNPNEMAALVTASFFSRTGSSLGSKTILVGGRSRANLKLNDLLSASGVATVVSSDLPVVIERPEYFGSPNDAGVAGSDVFGRNGAGVSWSFPAGDTAGNEEYLLVYNPSPTTVPIDVKFYGSDGKVVTKHVDVPPTVRYNIHVNALASGVTDMHGTVLHSTNGQGFVAEQTVFAPNYATLRSTEGLAQ
jgi:hypothetical protein